MCVILSPHTCEAHTLIQWKEWNIAHEFKLIMCKPEITLSNEKEKTTNAFSAVYCCQGDLLQKEET